MPVYEGVPQRFDWSDAIIGDTWQPATLVLKDESGATYDLTGVTGDAAVALEPGADPVLEPTVTVDAGEGTATWVSTAAQTADVLPGTYWYQVRLTWSSPAAVRTIVEGRVTFRRGVL